MNWDALGAIGTLVAGVAVLLTLVYLSIQVRQDSRDGRVLAPEPRGVG